MNKNCKMDLEIDKMWTLSTGHISLKDYNLLEKNHYHHTVINYAYGVIILVLDDKLPPREQSIDFVLDEEYESSYKLFSKEFIEILRIAQKNDISWIKFDRDGALVEELHEFNW